MPMTVMRTSGRVRHIRPLPSDSTTTTVPVSATAKFAPGDRDPRPQELLAQVEAGGLGQLARGRRSGPAGAGRPTRPISSMKMSRISRPVAMDRRHEDVRRQVVAELDDHLGEVGLPDVDALAGGAPR